MFFLNFILAGLLVGLIIFFALRLEPVRRRVEALPFYAQTYWNKWRLQPELPPPPAAAIDPATLLQGRTEAAEQPLTDAPAESAQVQLVATTAGEIAPIAPQVELKGFTHEWQTWNNCGPVTIAMTLSYFGYTGSQIESAQFLKPNTDDKNVNPAELADFARLQGFEALVRVGGDLALLKQLLSNGLPVIVETWLDPEDNGGLGHYRLFTGYDEAGNYFIAQDSLHGPELTVPMTEFDAFWQVFNRKYVLVFRPEQTALVHAILGVETEDTAMFEQALLTAQNEARLDPQNSYAWFNLATNYADLGETELAAAAFDEARRLGLPYRMLWYQFEMFEAYLAAGRFQEVVDLSTATLEAAGGLEELYFYRGQAQVALGQADAAAEDFRAALAYNPNFGRATEALQALEGA
jgi:tetratricopeptide (TPR) repeat protein